MSPLGQPLRPSPPPLTSLKALTLYKECRSCYRTISSLACLRDARRSDAPTLYLVTLTFLLSRYIFISSYFYLLIFISLYFYLVVFLSPYFYLAVYLQWNALLLSLLLLLLPTLPYRRRLLLLAQRLRMPLSRKYNLVLCLSYSLFKYHLAITLFYLNVK